jgi:hypothetical protein
MGFKSNRYGIIQITTPINIPIKTAAIIQLKKS